MGCARTVLRFIPPEWSNQSTLVPLETWSDPAALAEAFFLGGSLTEQIRPHLLRQPEAAARHYLETALRVQENHLLQLRALDGGLLRIDVRSADPRFAVSYSLALIDSLREFLEEDLRSKSINTNLLAEKTQAKEALEAAEGRVIRAGQTTPGLAGQVQLRFAVQHYREALQRSRKAQIDIEEWRVLLDRNCPQVVVVSAPTYGFFGAEN